MDEKINRVCNIKDHERFRGVMFANYGCLACEVEKLIEKKEKAEIRIRELETALDITAGALEGSQGVVRELEYLNDSFSNDADKEHERVIQLEELLTKAYSHIKELKEELRRIRLGIENDYSDDPVMVINALKIRVKELVAGIESVRSEKDWDAKEYALIELYELIKKEKP